ncbi:endospore germination permease [Paenibacillus dokdonensis]|uniref:Endospore germination permease n=1 Tax=Paenibacillus dokdonensis TaxID=2567944 RepID=A0ABU6GRB2_9BACL|nr:endospore germination permease [Paenibacillus dokdonensis]MEC0242314.1 endospore germination permease [Paenibacillus dokdonensis]
MQNITKISIPQICMLLMLMNGLTSHVVINPMVLDASGRDAWISVLFTTVLLVPWTLMLALFMKRSGQKKLQPWLAERTNPVISWIMVAPMLIHLYLIGGITLYHTSSWTISNYLPATPKVVLIGTLALVCFYTAKLGIKSIAIGAGILLPIVVILGFFVSVANSSEKNYSMLTPLLEHGIAPPIHGMLYVGGGFVEILVLLTMQHRIESKVKPWQLVVYGLIISFITLGPIVGGITEFGPEEAAKQMESPYEQWRLVKIGEYIEHVDFLSVYQWLAGASVRISLSQFLLVEMLPFKNRVMANRFILAVTFSYILIAMFPISQNTYYQTMYNYYFPITVFSSLFLSLIWLGVSFLPQKNKEGAA